MQLKTMRKIVSNLLFKSDDRLAYGISLTNNAFISLFFTFFSTELLIKRRAIRANGWQQYVVVLL
jgi:hypothetical protein